jgi:hypothetical protein
MTTAKKENTDPLNTDEAAMETNLETILAYYQDLPDGEAPDLLNSDDAPVAIRSMRTYREAGLLTSNKGLVVTLTDGSEFQLQIVRSK